MAENLDQKKNSVLEREVQVRKKSKKLERLQQEVESGARGVSSLSGHKRRGRVVCQ